MSLGHGASIVINGLVFYADAANPKSYPGTGTTWYDLSGKGNDSSIASAPVLNTHTFTLDGTDDYMNVPASDSMNLATSGDGSVSASMWVKSNHTSSVGFNIYWSGLSKYSQFILGPNNTNGKMAFLVYTSTWVPTNYSSAIWGQTDIDPRDFHMYTGTYDRTTGVSRLYVDGLEEVSFNLNTNTSVASDTGPMTIGKREVSSNFLNAEIGCPMVYNRALTAAEVLQNFEATRGRFGI